MPRTPAPGRGDYKRILAVKLADLGDLLTVTPALQALRSAYPSARIDLLVPPSSASLLRGASYIDDILAFDKFPFDQKRGLLDPRRLIQTALFLTRLRLSGYDALVLFHHFATRWGTFKFTAVSYATGAGVKVGLDNGRARFLNLRATDDGFGAMHEADYWLSLVGLLGADTNHGWRPHIPVDPASRTNAEALLLVDSGGKNHAAPFVALHPGAGWYSRARIWPVEEFASVARGLIKSHNATIVVLGGPDEQEAAARLEQLVANDEHLINLAGKTNIHETAAVIEHCHLFLGNDSGPMHIAAAVQTPVVAVFGPSNAAAWGPYTPPGESSPHTVVARSDLPCMPCFYRGHSLGLREGCGTRECLTMLRHYPVLDACRKALDKQGEVRQYRREIIGGVSGHETQ